MPKLLALQKEIPLPSEAGIPADLRPKLSIPLSRIFKDLDSSNTHVKGTALELLALNLLIVLDLEVVSVRRRRAPVANAEVDITANGVHLHYSRWLLQCKAMPSGKVKQDYLLREVALAQLLKAHVILMVTTGEFALSTKVLADRVSIQTMLQVLLIDGQLLKRFETGGVKALVEILRQQARHVRS